MHWKSYIPSVNWIAEYSRNDLRKDFVAGLTVCVVLVPQGMAYAMLAGLPPVYGLYAAIIPLILYAIFGTSRQLSVGPVALVSLLVLSGISKFAEAGTELFVSLAIITALIAGVIQLLLGLFRMGFLINFFSHPVISGFTSAAALIIGFSQLKNFMGLSIGRSNDIQSILADAFRHATDTHLPTLIIAILGLVLILWMKRVNRQLPGALIVTIIGTVAVALSGISEHGVQIVGNVPGGLPDIVVPGITFKLILELMPLALTITLISFIESLAIARTIQSRHKSYEIDANQELIALGISKIAGSFFQSYPTTGSFTRSAINDEAGARTGMSSIITAGLIVLTLLFLTPLFYFLPNAILAAIIVSATINLVNYKEAIYLWKTDKRDFLTLLSTFLITLTIGVQEGVLAGVVLSIIMMVYHNSVPHITVLGQLPRSKYYRSKSRFPEAILNEAVLIVRFDAQLYFGNASYFKDSMLKLIKGREEILEAFILDASNIHHIDSSGVHVINELIDILEKRDIKLYLSGAIGPVRDQLFKTGLMQKIGAVHQFMHVHDAMQTYLKERGRSDIPWAGSATQTNIKKPIRQL